MSGPLHLRSGAPANVGADPAAAGWLRAALAAARVGVRRLWMGRGAAVVLRAGQGGEQSACVAARVAPGWYMLEVAVSSSRTQLDAHVELRDGPAPEAMRARFPLYSKRLCKRLVLVPAGQTVSLVFATAVGEVALEACRLVPVTPAFARSRMLGKLQALHPLYRHDASRAGAAFAQLWHDYGALFEAASGLVPYGAWLDAFGHPPAGQQAATRGRLAALPSLPAFSLIVAVGGAADGRALAASVEAIRGQAYAQRQLIVVAPGAIGIDPGLLDERACVLAYSAEEGLAGGLTRAVAAATGEWMQFLHAGDLLAADALSILALALAQEPHCALAYTDEDTIGPGGERRDPCFKPDWDIDLFHAQNYVGASAVFRGDLVRACGPFGPDRDGAQLFDLLLRCAERLDAGAVRHIPRILLHRAAGRAADETAAGALANEAGADALRAHFGRCGIDADVMRGEAGYRVRYAIPAPAPLVTLIIPTRNGLDLLSRCIASVFNRTSYPHYDLIVVDNGSDDPATLRYLAQLATRANVRVLRDDRPFNYSALNNLAVGEARGEIVGLLNNDLEVISPDWLTEMVGHALRPGVGAVGARLWYADDTLQHAGVILGMEGTAGHLHRFLPRGQPGYCGRALVTQSFSAVTGACLVIRKETYALAGGLDEAELPVACNDIDFCLRVRARGYRNVWTPYAELYHHESSSRGLDDTGEKARRAARENACLRARWAPLLEADPAYNPNLSLDFTDVVLAWPPRGGAAGDPELSR